MFVLKVGRAAHNFHHVKDDRVFQENKFKAEMRSILYNTARNVLNRERNKEAQSKIDGESNATGSDAKKVHEELDETTNKAAGDKDGEGEEIDPSTLPPSLRPGAMDSDEETEEDMFVFKKGEKRKGDKKTSQERDPRTEEKPKSDDATHESVQDSGNKKQVSPKKQASLEKKREDSSDKPKKRKNTASPDKISPVKPSPKVGERETKKMRRTPATDYFSSPERAIPTDSTAGPGKTDATGDAMAAPSKVYKSKGKKTDAYERLMTLIEAGVTLQEIVDDLQAIINNSTLRKQKSARDRAELLIEMLNNATEDDNWPELIEDAKAHLKKLPASP